MKSFLPIAIFLEALFAIWFANSLCDLRPALIQAMRQVKMHPTSEEAVAELRHQQQLSRLMPFAVGSVVFGILVLPHAVGEGVRYVRSRRLLRASKAPLTTPQA